MLYEVITNKLYLIEDAEKVYIRAEDGTRLPFVRLNGELTSREPKVELSGRGVAVNFGVSEHFVITSYSIHYTKLYDISQQAILNGKNNGF